MSQYLIDRIDEAPNVTWKGFCEITEAIGERWVTDLDELVKLRPLADDAAFRERFLEVKRAAKLRFVEVHRRVPVSCES